MIFVCTDLDGKSQWMYDADTQKYMRLMPDGNPATVDNGKLLAHLYGRDLPNPDLLWQNRCKAAGVTTTSIAGTSFKPTPTTYALWGHWQGVKNA